MPRCRVPLRAPSRRQVSGYIDFGHRLAADGGSMEAVFSRKKRLMPRPTDLSFYNWETHLATSNPTPNFQVRWGGALLRPAGAAGARFAPARGDASGVAAGRSSPQPAP